MAYEKFGEDVVYEMSLTEALSGEKEGEVLLKSPNYVRVLSILKSELPKYKEQIEEIEDDEKREKCLKAYQKLDTIVSKSPDIPDIIAAGMKKNNGKYIVFCKDREDMFDKIEHAEEIFGKVNSKINIDYVITKKDGEEDTKGKNKNENERTLELFETRENGEELNLLFCVDMLNEGVHIDGIDGVVLFDLTSSPILYKQRIGRALSSDKNAGEAVIIDAANNWLAQIETYKEIEMAIQAGRQREKESEEKDWDLLKLLPEELELIEILREIEEELKYNNKFDFDEFINWIKNHDGEIPAGNIYENGKELHINEMTEEQKMEVRLKRKWYTSEEKQILEKYKGRLIEEVPEEYREKIRVLREYGLGLEEKDVYEQIIEWLKEHNGKLPRQDIFVKKKRLISSEKNRIEKKETSLRKRWKNSIEKSILEEYKGRPLEEVPEEYREKIRVLREFGLGGEEKDVYEQIIEWLKQKEKIPKTKITRNGKELKRVEMTDEEKEEVELGKKWNKSKERKILEKYKGRLIEEVPEEYREKIRVLREFGVGVEVEEKNIYDEILEWLDTHNGILPRQVIFFNGKRVLSNERSKDEQYEVNLRNRWDISNEKQILEEYKKIPLEELPEEYRKKIGRLREYGVGQEEKTTYEEIIEWLTLYKKMPRKAICKNGKAISVYEMNNKEQEEVNLRARWKITKERIVLEEYKGRLLEEVPEEYREKIRVLRGYGLGLTKEEELKRKMQKAVGKKVAHNEETRKELEGPDKSLETEADDVEK